MKSLQSLSQSLQPQGSPLTSELPTPAAIEFCPTAPAGYVWPALTTENAQPEVSRILLIEAPGAVGKSAAASALAASLNWPLVHAHKMQVGDYALSGLLQDVLGFGSSFIADLHNGTAGIVIDALDEAHLKAGTTNFFAFLNNISSMMRKESETTSVILFSRPDTAGVVELYFSEHNIALVKARLNYFDQNQSKQYIASYMQRRHDENPKGNYDVSVKHSGAFAKLRDMRLGELAQVLNDKNEASQEATWRNAQAFLGYAPVLSVVAESLAVSNPTNSDHTQPFGKSDSTTLLLKIVEDILRREQVEKFLPQVKHQLEAALPASIEYSSWTDCYSVDDQVSRLLGRFFNLRLNSPLPGSLPQVIRAKYESHCNQFILDHPFMSGKIPVSAVFADYLKAQAMVNPACRVVLDPNPQSVVHSAGPFFSQFLHVLAPKESADSTTAVIDENLLPLIFESYTKLDLADRELPIVYQEHKGTATLAVPSSAMTGSGGHLNFLVTNPTGITVLTGLLRNAVIITDTDVILEGHDKSFYLGPNVRIIASEVEISAERISIDPTPGRPNSIISRSVRGGGPLVVEAPRPSNLEIASSEVWPTLRPFSKPMSLKNSYVTYSQYMDTRAIFRFFKKGAGHSPSVYAEKLEQAVIGNNQTRSKVLDTLLERNVVTKENDHYYLNVDMLAAQQVKLQSLVDGSPDTPELNFISNLELNVGNE